MASENTDSAFLPGLVVGALAGATLGMLLAPRPGGETLALLLDRSAELRDRASEFLDEAHYVLRVATRKASGYDPQGL